MRCGTMVKDEYKEFNEEKDIYDKEGIQGLRDEGQISDWEAGFMEGASGGGSGAKCRKCGKIFTDGDKVLERDIDGERHLFCSDECVKSFFERKEKEENRLI